MIMDARRVLDLRLTRYIPHRPHPKQRAFLMLPHREAFYGGSAGGGKSDALLMGALQYVDIPEYSAILFRRTFADLELRGALMDRAQEWLAGSDARWNGSSHKWTFPSGATLQFGYLDTSRHKLRYQSAYFNYIGFDELTQFNEEDYVYLFSRQRRSAIRGVPNRVRTASNPGGIGHAWVRRRYDIRYDDQMGMYLGHHPDRVYLPATLEDNPSIDQDDYDQSLMELDPVTRAQLRRGDWGITTGKVFRKEWARHYWRDGRYIILDPSGNGPAIRLYNIPGTDVTPPDVEIFMIVDTATTAKDLVARASRQPSHTAIGIFGKTKSHNDLVVLHFERHQADVPAIMRRIYSLYEDWHPTFVGVENAHAGIAVVQILRNDGVTVRALSTECTDKVTRSIDVANLMESGKVWFPASYQPWMDDLETELYNWTGDPNEPDDQIDVMSYAGKHIARKLRRSGRGTGMPFISGMPGR